MTTQEACIQSTAAMGRRQNNHIDIGLLHEIQQSQMELTTSICRPNLQLTRIFLCLVKKVFCSLELRILPYNQEGHTHIKGTNRLHISICILNIAHCWQHRDC